MHPLRRRGRLTTRRVAALAVLTLLATPLASCRQGALAFGDAAPGAGAGARAAADDLLGALAARFTNVTRTAKFSAARPRLARYALTPSKIERDTSVWTATTAGDGSRILAVAGVATGERYVFDARPAVPLPTHVGDSRHFIRLRPLGEAQYEWVTTVEQSVGRLAPTGFDEIADGLLRGVATLPEPLLRTEYREHFPRTTAALGRLFTMDTIRSVPHREGGRIVSMIVTLHPDRLQRTMPAFAEYVRKYVAPARYHWTVRDQGGMRWLEATADDDRLTLRFRTQDGNLLPFEGAPRPMPEAVRLEGEMFVKVMIFEVGASRIVADMRRLRTPWERGWQLRFQQEPEWHLPLATKHLLRAPLRRPFEQGGAMLTISLRHGSTPAAPTLLTRGFSMVVQESAILRWLGVLGNTAVSDFAGASEREENRFIAEAFGAMRADTRAVLAGVPVSTGGAEGER